ncbi:MAG: Fic family protein [Subdoligranulum sp.]|nr:Fic family protein [Subdoligranulum sp.]
MKYIRERLNDYNANCCLNELCAASKGLGALEAQIDSYQFNSILIPMLHKKEAISSMYIEGTQTTLSEVFENEVARRNDTDLAMVEVRNHTDALIFGADHLRNEPFSNSFIQKLHSVMMKGILPDGLQDTLGKYKKADNRIVNSVGTIVFSPPSYKETKRYMDELLEFMNNERDGINPLIKAAISHAQFESIHPFDDGNGRVGRLLVSLYLYKANVINFPFFYISEAISQNKSVYYSKLTDSRKNSYDEWIRYFLGRIIVQTEKHIQYIKNLNDLYKRTRDSVRSVVNSPKFDRIIEQLFTHPVLTVKYLAQALDVSDAQAKRYINLLESKQILLGDDRKRGRTYYFAQLLDLAGGL